MTSSDAQAYVSRGGDKLAAALDRFDLDVTGLICADLGSHVGGFVDCLLRRGAARVYSVDTAYGLLAWRLRKDPRVVVTERTNAMHVTLPEPIELVTIDAGWTKQCKILPNVVRMLKPTGKVVTLVKPHYEVHRLKATDSGDARLVGGVLRDEAVDEVVQEVVEQITKSGWRVLDTIDSPLRGHAGNREVFALLVRR